MVNTAGLEVTCYWFGSSNFIVINSLRCYLASSMQQKILHFMLEFILIVKTRTHVTCEDCFLIY